MLIAVMFDAFQGSLFKKLCFYAAVPCLVKLLINET
uniref:Uncharacterized protein n=1 Tax=Anguilla anguilla TaxID=7936 RepID=A0A0E9QEE6_ANGAN